MTEAEVRQQLILDLPAIILTAKSKVKKDIPIDTGNLRDYAFRDEPMGVRDVLREYRHRVYFNQKGEHKYKSHDGIAPYTAAVNERVSRVQGWYDEKMVPHFAEWITRLLKERGYDAELKG